MATSKKKKKYSSFEQYVQEKYGYEEIGPVKEQSSGYFQPGALSGGFNLSNIGKTILGTYVDINEDLTRGGLGLIERTWDGIVQLGPSVTMATHNMNGGHYNIQATQVLNDAMDVAKAEIPEYIAKDLIEEDTIAKKIIVEPVENKTSLVVERDSSLGAKGDELVASSGDMIVRKGLGKIPVVGQGIATVLTGLSSVGGEAENAYRNGATYEEALLSGMISAGAELGSEAIGGIKFGNSTLTDGIVDKIVKNVPGKLLKTLGKWGFNAATEGAEEVISGGLSAIGQKLTYADEKELNELFSKEDAWDSFVAGTFLGGTFGGADIVNSAVHGVDYATGLTKNEQKVFDKVYNDAIAEQEADGKKLTAKEKSKIYDSVSNAIEKGYIDTDIIESTLGGENYTTYKNLTERQSEMQKEYDEIYKMKNIDKSDAQIDRQAELKSELANIKKQIDNLKPQIDSDIAKYTQGSKLAESYNEKARKGDTFTADLTKYDAKQKEVVKKAMDSGILNNTNRTHDFVDMVAKISAEKGVSFDFTNNQKLKDSGFAVDGKTVNGFVNNNNVTLNIDSAKSLNSVVGHEITHVLEGTELYGELQSLVKEYASMKGEYQSRLISATKLYKDVEGADIDAEITADLIGDYLFTDSDFISRLSTEKPNIFKRIFDEIKYLYNVATAGSKEARELEKVKRAFEKAYREGGETKSDVLVKYDIDSDGLNAFLEQVKSQKGQTDSAYNQHRLAKVPSEVADGIYKATEGRVNAENKSFALEGGKLSHEFISHGDENTEKAKGQKPYSERDINKIIETLMEPDIIEDISSGDKMDQRNAVAFAKEIEGEMIVVAAVGGKRNPNIVPEQILWFTKEKWDAVSESGATLREVIYENNPKRGNLSQEEKEKIKKNRVTVVHGESTDSSARYVQDVPRSPLENSIPHFSENASDNRYLDAETHDDNVQIENGVKAFDGDTVTKYSLSTWTPETQTKVKDNLVKAGYETDRVDKWIKDVNGIASVIASDKDRLDFEAADNQTMLKNNQEYVKTLDASTLCAKRLAYQGTFDAIQHRLPNTVLSSDDLIELQNMMKEHGVEAPCSVCYVESRRRHLGKFAQEWLDGYEGEYKPSLDEVTTSDGLENLRHTHPRTYKDFVDAMNKKGSSNPKVVQLRTEYRNEIMSLTPKQIENIEAIGGLRVQSFSDFETPHLLDMMQAVMDMSAKGLTSQAYTKVPNFAWVFGDTGIKINLSLIAEGDGFDSNGNLAFSSVEGMDINDAMALRDAYSENVGTIIVGANDKHILACMADDRIDFIIPFHRSGWGQKELDMMGMGSYKDYSYGQNEHSLETGKKVANLYPSDYWDYNLSGKENAERYLNICARTGREPKFSDFLVDNGDGSYSLQPDGSTDGYWKTLIDFKMYDNDGNGVKQQKVQPNFNMEEAHRVLNEYEGGANKLPVAEDVVEAFVAKYQSNDIGPAMSLSDSSQDAPEYGNYNVYGKDISLNQDIAPTAEETTTPQQESIPSVAENIAPTVAQTPVEEVTPSAVPTTQPIGETSDIAPTTETATPVQTEEVAPKSDGQVAKVLTEEPENGKKKSNTLLGLAEELVDKGLVFEILSKKTKNRNLEAKWNYIRYADGMAQNFIGNGADGVRPLADIQKEVNKAGLTEKLYEYVYHKHNIDRMSLENRYEDVPNKAVFGDSVTADVSREVVSRLESQYPALKKYANEVYAFNNHLRQMLVDGGVISQETADLWSEMYPNYVPIRRAGDVGLNINVPLDTGRTGVNAPVKKAVGGSEDILPLFDTMAQRAFQTYKAVAKNRFGVELKNTLGTTVETEATDIDGIIEGIEAQDELLKEGKYGKNPTFTVFDNGEKVTFEITEDMYNALKPTNKKLAETYKIPNLIGNIHRSVLTEFNPAFLVKNIVKDAQDVLINSQHPARTYKNFPKAISEMAKKGKWFTEYMKNGGEQNTYFDREKNTFKKEKSGLSKAIGIPFEAISNANNAIERLPRLAEYIASRESGRGIEESMLDAARVTTNFVAGGDFTKYLNRNGATFLNASVQGFTQQVRNVAEAKMNGFKGWAQLATKFAVAGLPVLLLNGLMWDDDEDYDDLSDYVKQNYYIVAKYGDGKFVRIPKGRTVAVIQDALQQTMNSLTGDDEADWEAFADLFFTNLAPNNPIENNILAPIIQAKTNTTWYGDDLVPTRLQDLPPGEQSDESTDAISKWLGEKTNISPYKINYLIDQYTGVVGDVVLPMFTPEAESGDDSLLGNLLAPVKNAFTTDSVMNNQNVSDFYDTSDELTMNAKKSYATDEDVLANKYFNSVKTEVGKLYAEKREIQNSDLSDSEKYYLVREVQKKIDAIAKETLSEYEDVRIDGGYASVGDMQYRKSNSGWEKLDDKQVEKQNNVISSLGISASEYWNNKAEYDFAYESPGKYAVSNVVGGYDKYTAYADAIGDFDAKDENGNTVSGLKKSRTKDYIFGLDLDYGQKALLYRTYYDSQKDKEEYDSVIKKYLNSRDDISYEEIAEIYKALEIQ